MTSTPSRPSRTTLRTVLGLLAAAAVLGYPVVVYLGLTRVGTRSAAWVLLLLCLGHTWVHTRRRQRIAWRSALAVPLCAAAIWLDDKRYVLALPVLINAALFATFFSSLYGPMPLCERFARMQVADLTAREQVYCRSVTKLWCGFFVLNGGTAAALAALGALDGWTLYTGLVSYILIGLVAATEYIVRKLRFGRFSDGLHDRMLRALFALLPIRSTPP